MSVATTPGLLTFTLKSETIAGYTNTVNGATCYIGKVIPHQTIVWRGYCIIMDSSADAVTQQDVYLRVPWLTGNCLTDMRPYATDLPCMLNGNVVTCFTEMTMPLQLTTDIPQIFTAALYNRDGTPVDSGKVLFAQFYFSYGQNSVSGYN